MEMLIWIAVVALGVAIARPVIRLTRALGWT